jgi:hypothetical protein
MTTFITSKTTDYLRGDRVMFCEQCGTKNLETSKFCSECGARLINYPIQSAPRPATTASAYSPPEETHSRIRGYSRICVWLKKKYSGKVTGISDPNRMKGELEKMAGDRRSGIPAKTWTGFLEYLKKQNYQEMLK